MSIIVSVKINDGIVMAADSRTSLFDAQGRLGHAYEHANKIVNLVKGLPIGVMTCGAGDVGNASIATLLKDLRQELSYSALDPAHYTMEIVAEKVREFFAAAIAECSSTASFLLRVCGYSAAKPLPELWDVSFSDGKCDAPICVQGEASMGVRWAGEREALDRLILGSPSSLADALAELEVVEKEKAKDVAGKLIPHLYNSLIHPAAPIQDAIDLARFLVATTEGFLRFSLGRQKTVGGPVEIAAITKHEAFKWVQRKHFFDRERNPAD